MAKTRFTVDLKPELFMWLTEEAKKNGLSRNAVIAQAIIQYRSKGEQNESV